MKTPSVIVIAIGTVVLAVAVWGVVRSHSESGTETEREKPVSAPSRVSQVDGLAAITLDAAAQKTSGVVVAAQQATSHRREMQALGTVLSIEDFSGLRTAYIAAESQQETAAAAAAAARAEYQRLRELHDGNQDISTKALQAAEATWRADEAALRIAQAGLATAQHTANQQWGSVLAQAAAADSPLYARLVTQQEVLLQVVVPAGVEIVPPTRARVQLRREAFVSAQLISEVPRTDPRLQGLSFLYRAPATGLLPGTSLTVYLPAGDAAPGSMIPASAIIWWQGRAWVYTQDRPDRFVRRALPPDQSMEGGWFVPTGFAHGEKVVVSGAQMLFSEEQRTQSTAGGDTDG